MQSIELAATRTHKRFAKLVLLLQSRVFNAVFLPPSEFFTDKSSSVATQAARQVIHYLQKSSL